ncbi:MAG TPA: YbaK/EbsC family protein [Pirellulaceae bacterium]|nr:YbaK/EbsC family protein [Pirellulaceae bacterium]HMO91639.1 YbaK/EbsC family protein [Pirellulaceae bacterium]HMP68336.1 YbaK/EbsC family protein [Pirellulaceae bacterium]
MKIVEFLREHQVPFDVVEHQTTFTARELAATASTPIYEVAKTVLLRADHGFQHFVVVLPANKMLDLAHLSHALGGSEIELASEEVLSEFCPDCERGVLPPFGSQYGLKTILDSQLLNCETIMFEGNSHREAIRLKAADFQRIEEPLIIHIPNGSAGNTSLNTNRENNSVNS